MIGNTNISSTGIILRIAVTVAIIGVLLRRRPNFERPPRNVSGAERRTLNKAGCYRNENESCFELKYFNVRYETIFQIGISG